MSLYAFVISLHVVVALLGGGLVAAIPLGARSARRSGVALDALGAWTQPLLRLARVSLGLAFLSGALLDYVAHGPFHEAGWFRLAALLLVLTAVSLSRAQAGLKQGLAGKLSTEAALRRLERWGFTSSAAVACIAVLMEWKPF